MTVVAIHQPNFIPWYGYFHKIMSSDKFVFLDDVKFSHQQMGNRVRIKNRNGYANYITVAVNNEDISKFCKVKIIPNSLDKILNIVKYNYSSTSYFRDTFLWLEEILSRNWTYLSDLNEYIIRDICEILDIKPDFYNSSELKINDSIYGTDKLIGIVKHLSGDTYLSGNGSWGYLKPSRFNYNNVRLVFQDMIHPEYDQRYGDFIAGLSILDMLMNVGEEETRRYLTRQ